jgi:hypothetical protein
MTYWTDAPLPFYLPRKSDAPKDRVLNMIAATVLALLAVGLVLAPAPAPSSDPAPSGYRD